MTETDNSCAVIQTIGGALGVSAAQAAFQNKLLSALRQDVPSLDPFIVLNSGATNLRELVGPSNLSGVLQAYIAGFRETLIVAIALAGVALFVALGFRHTTVSAIRAKEDQE